MRSFPHPLMTFPSYFWDTAEGRRLFSPDKRRLFYKAREADPANTPNDFPLFDLLMQDRMCAELPDELCAGHSDTPIRAVTKQQLKRFFETLHAVIHAKLRAKSLHVPQAEAERRSVICCNCVNNQPIQCSGCSGFAFAGHVYLAGRSVKRNDDLQACGLCGCYLRAKVFLTDDIIADLYPEIEFPEKCWVTDARNRRQQNTDSN